MSNGVGANLHSPLKNQQQWRPSSPSWTVGTSVEGVDSPVVSAMAVEPAMATNSPAASSKVMTRRRVIVDLPSCPDSDCHH